MERLKEFLVKFKNFSQVKAIAIGGSGTAKTSDNLSDIDIYVFVENDIPCVKSVCYLM